VGVDFTPQRRPKTEIYDFREYELSKTLNFEYSSRLWLVSQVEFSKENKYKGFRVEYKSEIMNDTMPEIFLL
jgi:hypothetical protein